jgi:glutathione S-transferase
MRLYHHPLSSNSRRAVMTARYLELEIELVAVDLASAEHRSPEFLRLNPNGKVPVLDDEGFVLWESHAIMQYLADKTPAQELYPRGVEARADVNRWRFWSAAHFTAAVGLISREKLSKRMVGGAGGPDPVEVARGETMVRRQASTRAAFSWRLTRRSVTRLKIPKSERPRPPTKQGQGVASACRHGGAGYHDVDVTNARGTQCHLAHQSSQ